MTFSIKDFFSKCDQIRRLSSRMKHSHVFRNSKFLLCNASNIQALFCKVKIEMSKYQLAGSLEKKTLTLQEKIKFLDYAEANEKLHFLCSEIVWFWYLDFELFVGLRLWFSDALWFERFFNKWFADHFISIRENFIFGAAIVTSHG